MVVSKDERSNLKPALDVKMKHRKGQVVVSASINLYLRMWGFLFNEGLGGNSPPNPEKEWVIEESRPMTCPLILS